MQHRQAALEEAEFLLQVLPQDETDALYLDLAVIHHVVTLLTGQPTLDRIIIPVYDVGPGRSWRHQERYLPSTAGRLPVHLVFMDRGQEPDLRAYVWLVHELVHVVLARYLHLFAEGRRLAAQRVQEWRLAGLASDDPASEQLAAEFSRYWSPGHDQEDWPHEIVVDTICMLLLGPAYAEALHHHYREVAANVPAYLIEPSHIPLELRTRAMIRMGEHLGWGSVMQPLRELQSAWEQQWPEAARASRYRALRDDELIWEAQRAALAFCEDRQLRRLTPGLLATITEASDNVESLEGIELIIAAWWVGREVSDDEYRAWGARAVRGYADHA
ncbi:hypothetical protein V3W47_01790 [Deinococcus sp. YIM 134068]|uniref:hypothetical protein n=1 Tax=Deinococcus lichenicola TaxID=3118910 RepID=UPI002F936987